MEIPRHPLRPFTSALRAVAGKAHRTEVWLPFFGLAVLKALALVATARIDLIPTLLLTPVLVLLPGVERFLHYPAALVRLPRLATALDLVVFLSVGALAQGWAITRLSRAWGHEIRIGSRRRAFERGGALIAIAALLVAVPLGIAQGLRVVGLGAHAPVVAMGAGMLVALLFFTAPAFVMLHDLSLRQALGASSRLVARLPVALPLAVLLVSVLHIPGLVMRTPAIRAAVTSDPDWILMALLAQLPAEVLGAALAAGLSAYFALRTGVRRSGSRLTGLTPVAATLVALCLGGCDRGTAEHVTLRYGCERVIERTRLHEASLYERTTPADTATWIGIAASYGDVLERLGTKRLTARVSDPLERDLGRLACDALLGQAGALARTDRVEPARRAYRMLLDVETPYRGAQGDAALGLARCEDRDARWNAAFAAYQCWMQGIRDGRWTLHREALAVPTYVARRLRDRGASAARDTWVDLAVAALDAAAARGELQRDALTARFALQVGARRWEDAYGTLHRLHDGRELQDRDGALLVAEASLLAGGLGREHEALGILSGLNAEKSPFDAQQRVAGWLLLGQIHSHATHWEEAERAYQSALDQARSASGRSEATLGLARVCAARGDIDAAHRLYTQLRDLYPSTPAGLVGPIEELRFLRARGDRDAARAAVATAVGTYRSVIQQFGTELPALIAAQHLSECMGLEGHWDRGVAFLDSIASTFGDDPRAGSLLVCAARLSVTQLDDPRRAGSLLAQLQARWPDSDVAVLARGFADSLGARLDTP